MQFKFHAQITKLTKKFHAQRMSMKFLLLINIKTPETNGTLKLKSTKPIIIMFINEPRYEQGVPRSGKKSGKCIFFPGQGKLREFQF